MNQTGLVDDDPDDQVLRTYALGVKDELRANNSQQSPPPLGTAHWRLYIPRQVQQDQTSKTVERGDPDAEPILHSMLSQEWELLSGLERSRSRMLIVADVGMGKSALLENFTWQLASALALRPASAPVPLLVRLRDWATMPLTPTQGEGNSENRLMELLTKRQLASKTGAMSSGWLRKLASVGRLVLLLDGLDEVPAGGAINERQELITAINRSLRGSEELANASAVLTSRPESVDHYLCRLASEFSDSKYLLNPLTSQQIARYVKSVGEAQVNLSPLDREAPPRFSRYLARPLTLALFCEFARSKERWPSSGSELLCLDPLISVMFLLCSLVSGPAPAYDNPSC